MHNWHLRHFASMLLYAQEFSSIYEQFIIIYDILPLWYLQLPSHLEWKKTWQGCFKKKSIIILNGINWINNNLCGSTDKILSIIHTITHNAPNRNMVTVKPIHTQCWNSI
jgi:hypothetical protein